MKIENYFEHLNNEIMIINKNIFINFKDIIFINFKHIILFNINKKK